MNAVLKNFYQKKVLNECLSAESLNSIEIRCPKKIIKSLSIDCEKKIYCENFWKVVNHKNKVIGQITSGAFSPDQNKIVALGMINKDFLNSENHLFTIIDDKKYLTNVHEKPFI